VGVGIISVFFLRCAHSASWVADKSQAVLDHATTKPRVVCHFLIRLLERDVDFDITLFAVAPLRGESGL
jgi:hypothetical protein